MEIHAVNAKLQQIMNEKQNLQKELDLLHKDNLNLTKIINQEKSENVRKDKEDVVYPYS